MEDRILKFISALRASGLRISLAESADAFKAIQAIGIIDRELFRYSLQATLVKDSENIPIFDELFPIFFGSIDSPSMMKIAEDLSPEEATLLAEVLQQFNQKLRRILEKLINGDNLNNEELENLARMVGLNRMGELRYREWIVQRMKRALGFKEVQHALLELAELLTQLGMNKERVNQIMQILYSNQKAQEDQLHQFAGQRLTENMSENKPEDNINDLINRPFSSLSERDMEQIRKEVRRLANILRTRIALRQKRAKTGQLDAKATIRANLKHGNVPIYLKYRDRSLKPKLIVICDVSTSMRYCSELMLSLIYAMQDQITKTSAFAFIDHIEYISPEFADKEAQQAVTKVLDRMSAGYYNTDLGNSLEDFQKKYFEMVDSHSTFIIVGDGRNNYNNPRLDIFNRIARRSRRTIWLNPEAPTLWGSGDSDMLKYAPSCDAILHASSLGELTTAIDKLLLS